MLMVTIMMLDVSQEYDVVRDGKGDDRSCGGAKMFQVIGC
jgi:hypothetical protein